MKFFLAIALIASVASATFLKPTVVSGELAEIQEIIAAIQSPSTDPATAAALQDMLLEVLGIQPEPVSIGPAPLPEGLIEPSPVVIGEIAAGSPSPLVQIIVNVNTDATAAAPSPVAEAAPIDFDLDAIVDPVQVVEVAPAPVDPVQVVEVAPEPVEPVIIETPILPAPAVTLPEELN